MASVQLKNFAMGRSGQELGFISADRAHTVSNPALSQMFIVSDPSDRAVGLEDVCEKD